MLEGIGEEIVGNDPAQPLDILALEETTDQSHHRRADWSGLNSFYGVAGMYSNSTYQATQFGGSANNGNGNGPNAMVYNAETLQLLASSAGGSAGRHCNLGSASGRVSRGDAL